MHFPPISAAAAAAAPVSSTVSATSPNALLSSSHGRRSQEWAARLLAREDFDTSPSQSPRTSNRSNNRTLGEYNALFDPHCRSFLSRPQIQQALYRNGLIDREGRVLDPERNRQKIHAMEQEARLAERQAELLQRDHEAQRHATLRIRQMAEEAQQQADRVRTARDEDRRRAMLRRSQIEALGLSPRRRRPKALAKIP